MVWTQPEFEVIPVNAECTAYSGSTDAARPVEPPPEASPSRSS
jgi:hypothetical protein